MKRRLRERKEEERKKFDLIDSSLGRNGDRFGS